MEGMRSAALQRALLTNRERCNARFESLSARCGPLDGAAFAAVVKGLVQRVVAAMEHGDSVKAESAAQHVFDTALTLFAKGYLGEHSHAPLVCELWEDILPRIPSCVAEAPRRLLADLSNAAVTLALQYPETARIWLERLRRIAPLCRRADEMLDSALVAAWTSGLAHYRESALQRWQRLDAPLRRACLGIDDTSVPSAALEGIARNPWCHPAAHSRPAHIRIAGTAGGFRGFGGPFVEPPLVTVDGHSIYAYDSEGCWEVFADCFGATLRRAPVEPPLNEAPEGCSPAIAPDGTVSGWEQRTRISELAANTSFGATPHMLAVTLAHSHYIYLVARTHGS